MRIYQTEAGFHGQKMVTGTRGTGMCPRSINAQVYGGFEDATMRSGRTNGCIPEPAIQIQCANNQ